VLIRATYVHRKKRKGKMDEISNVVVWAALYSSKSNTRVHRIEIPTSATMNAQQMTVAHLQRYFIKAFAPRLDEIAPAQLVIYHDKNALSSSDLISSFTSSTASPFWVTEYLLHSRGASLFIDVYIIDLTSCRSRFFRHHYIFLHRQVSYALTLLS
jgi:hypothetical protein